MIQQRSEAANANHDVLARLVAAATAAAGNDRADAKDTLEKAIALLTHRITGGVVNVTIPRGGLAPWQAERVATHVRKHIGSTLRTTGLAALVRLSSSHFNRAFKASFKDTPSVYVMRQRIRVAQEMMLSTSSSLAEIALGCGLCDQAHFSRLFRRFVGETPRVWRRQHAVDVASARDRVSH